MAAEEAWIYPKDIATIAQWDTDRFYIRSTRVATLYRPTGRYLAPECIGEIISIVPGEYAVTKAGKLVRNIGSNWIICHHIRTYKDAPKHK